MQHYWIHNEIAVDEDTIEVLANNGKTGDAYVELRRGERVDGKGPEYWLDTNGGPQLVTLDETDWSCSVEQAAESIGVESDALRKAMESHVWITP